MRCGAVRAASFLRAPTSVRMSCVFVFVIFFVDDVHTHVCVLCVMFALLCGVACCVRCSVLSTWACFARVRTTLAARCVGAHLSART